MLFQMTHPVSLPLPPLIIIYTFDICSSDPATEESPEISFAKEEVPSICFLLRGVDRLPMEPMLEEYWEDLARMGEA